MLSRYFIHRRWVAALFASGKTAGAAIALILSSLLLVACSVRTPPAVSEPALYDPAKVIRFAATPQRPEVIILPEANSLHNNKARVKLLVKAGTLQEADDQIGVAHFVEHMAFRGTAAYPEQQLQSRMRELGIQLGRHSNAYVTFDHTAYWLDLNDLGRGQLDAALEILAQWAYNIEFSPAALQQEIPVIIEELRRQQLEQDRIQPRLQATLFSGSRHLQRLPIAVDKASVAATTVAQLQQFYQQWYHPENMALVVSGDVDVAQTLALIEQYFVKTDLVSERLQPQVYDINPAAIPDVTALTDAYMPISALNLMWFYPIPAYSEASEQQGLALELALGVLRNRLNSKQLSSNGVVGGSEIKRNRVSANVRTLTMTVALTEADFALAYAFLEHELQRLLALGISEQEWQTQVSEWQARLQQAQDSPGRLANAAREFWLYNAPILNQSSHQQRRLALLQTLRPQLGIEALAKITSGRNITVALYPQGAEAPTAAKLAEYRQAAQQLPFAALAADKQPQWPALPASLGITAEHKRPDGFTEWQLANGITAYYRYSASQPGRVFIDLSAKNGTNQLSDEQVVAARLASSIIRDGGQAGLNSVELKQWRDKLDIDQGFYVDFADRSFYLAAPFGNIEQGLMDLHHRVQAYQLDAELWQFSKAQALQLWQQMKDHPHLAWYLARDNAYWQDDIRYRQLSAAEIEAATLAQAQAFYQQWVQGNQQYQLAIVGDLSAEQALALVDRYFASLPMAKPQSEARLTPQPEAAKQVRLAGSGQKHASIELSYYLNKAQLPQAWQDTPTPLLTQWVNEQLFDHIRTNSGLAYSIKAEISGAKPVNAMFSLDISLQTDPDNVDAAISAVKLVLAKAAQQAPTAQQVNAWQQSLADERMQNRQKPRWLLNRIGYSLIDNQTPWQSIAPLAEPAAPDSLAQLLRQITEQGHVVELVWLP